MYISVSGNLSRVGYSNCEDLDLDEMNLLLDDLLVAQSQHIP